MKVNHTLTEYKIIVSLHQICLMAQHVATRRLLTWTQGKLVALTGLAGSGKSRLLNMLAGDVEPSFGRVLVPSHLRFLLVTHQVFVMLGL